jgi:hypothetical protein
MSFQQCGKCNEIYDNVVPHSCKIDPAIAARDKWWITQMESKFFAAIGCRLFPDNCDSCSIIERCTALGWQRFKSTLEVK